MLILAGALLDPATIRNRNGNVVLFFSNLLIDE
jgi:hypothetical protein